MNFGSFVGNEALKSQIDKNFTSGRLPHAMILQGEDGLGKSMLSRVIANALVCSSPVTEAKPCGVCRSCVQAAAGSHPDIRVITGTGKSGTISTDAIRDMIEDSYKMPEESDRSVYILECGKVLSSNAQNAMLKVIEEPPEGACFIINIASAESLLVTIRSRAVTFTLRPVNKEQSVSACITKAGKSREECEAAFDLYGGNIGKMLSHLGYSDGTDKGKGSDNREKAMLIASAAAGLAASQNPNELLKATAPLIYDRALFSETSKLMEAIFRDAAVLRAGGNSMIGTDHAVSESLASSRTMTRLIALPGICAKYRRLCEGNANMKLLVTAFCAELRNAV